VNQSLSSRRLTDYVRKPFTCWERSTSYSLSIPLKRKNILRFEPFIAGVPGWGLVVYFEFNLIGFWCGYGVMALILSLGLLFGLYVPDNGPAHGQVGVGVAMFMAPWGLLGTVFAGAYIYATRHGY
jgi:hypothetical protein